MITENLSTLKIHKLTQSQYDRALEAGNIDASALYLTPDETHHIFEDGTYSGCFYRMINGSKEWLNPPMLDDIEYKTSERWLGSPVYTKAYYLDVISTSTFPSKFSFNLFNSGNTAIEIKGTYKLSSNSNIYMIGDKVKASMNIGQLDLTYNNAELSGNINDLRLIVKYIKE